VAEGFSGRHSARVHQGRSDPRNGVAFDVAQAARSQPRSSLSAAHHDQPMSADSHEQPFSESHLDSPEYRTRLLRKLCTLIAVLEVACAKVKRSLAGPRPDVERLTRIHKNLKDTLDVCLRAKAALERCERLPEGLPSDLVRSAGRDPSIPAGRTEEAGEKRLLLPRSQERRGGGRKSEMSSSGEEQRFDGLGPIDMKDIRAVDIDDLCRRLLS
jgi:hypothetical protein